MNNTIRTIDQRNPAPHPEIDIFDFHYGPVAFWLYPGRNAPFWYCYWNEEPGARITAGGRVFEPARNCIVLIPPYTTFDTAADRTFRQLFIHFTAGAPFDRMRREVMQLPLDESDIPRNPAEIVERSELGSLHLYAFLYRMLMKIPSSQFRVGAAVDGRIVAAVDCMARNFAQPMDNGELCRKIGMSEAAFLRLFRRELGTSPMRYRMQRRLEFAARLLSGRKDIDLVARQTGFADRYAFSKAFRAFYNMPPAIFRREQLQRESRIAAINRDPAS